LAKVKSEDVQGKKESEQLIVHLNRLNILPPNSSLDDVLALDIESVLSRRLQTLSYLKGLANTPDQARQLIIHGHIAIGERRVTIPGYMVTKDEEEQIGYTKDSPLNDAMHPARPKADFKSTSIIKKTKQEDTKKEEKKVEKTTEKKPEPIAPKEKPPEPVLPKEKTPVADTPKDVKNDLNLIKKGDE